MRPNIALFAGRHGRLLLTVAMFVGVATPRPSAQIAPSQTAPFPPDQVFKMPEFDVVSIKPDVSPSEGVRLMTVPDGFSATNLPLKSLIATAYGLKEDLVYGAPGWVDTTRFDVNAKVASEDLPSLKKLSPDQRRAMLQPVLADRFKLKSHFETTELPIYELVIDKTGSKLHQATPGDTYANGIKGPNGGSAGMMRVQPGKVIAQGVRIDALIDILSRQLRRTVVDKTNLTGTYDITLQFTPDEGPMPMLNGAPDTSGPSIFTALEEQLGLKLNSAKGQVKTLVVDHVDQPTEN